MIESRSVSQREVALLAGVSGQTVSRVATNSADVAEKTRAKVLAAMAELGYRPNVAARALRLGSFGSIGVVVFTLSTLGNVRTISGVLNEADRRDYAVELIQVRPSDEGDRTEGQVSSALSRLSQDAVDGIIIIIESHLISQTSFVIPEGVPSVIVEAGARPDRPSVYADQCGGTRAVVQHLLSLGHRDIWHVAGPKESNSAREREETWRQVLREADIEPHPAIVGDWTARGGYEIGLRLARRRGFSAIFAANDQMALGIMQAFHEAGLRIPEDVSVAGFDDMEESAHFWPPLTTVHQDFEGAGAIAVSLIVDEIEGIHVAAGARQVTTRLVVRESTGIAPG